jgi:hypothetical protein
VVLGHACGIASEAGGHLAGLGIHLAAESILTAVRFIRDCGRNAYFKTK